jgi:hypothetical protein
MEQNIMDFATQHEVFCSGNVFNHLGWSRTSWTLPHNTRYSAQVMFSHLGWSPSPQSMAAPWRNYIGEAA